MARARTISPRPAFIEPMKARAVTALPGEGAWQLEIKFDGYRALAQLHQHKVELWSRNARALAEDYPELVAELETWDCNSALLDGEIVALDEAGRSRFQLLQARDAGKARPPICYYVFDLLQVDGQSLLKRPLEERRAALVKVLPRKSNLVRLSPVFDTPPARLMEEARKQGLEGVIAKTVGSLYEPGERSGAWLKCRVDNEQEFVIGGFTPPQGARPHFGALLLGYYEGKELRYAGKVGTGFDGRWLERLSGLFAKRSRATCPFSTVPEERRAQWVRPDLIAQVRFVEWTADGRLRQPVFLGLRSDKSARDVRRETSAA